MTIRVFTEHQLAEALNNVKGLHEMAPELIAADVFAATPPVAQVQGEQEAFEAWYAGEYAGGNLECAKRYMTFEDGKYWQRDAQQSWAAWQARAALSAAPTPPASEQQRAVVMPKCSYLPHENSTKNTSTGE